MDDLLEQLDEIFPNPPFSISCFDSIDEIHEKFCDEQVVFIYDDRASLDNYYYEGFTEEELSKLRNYTKVTASNNKYVTHKDAMDSMINDPHYHNELIMQDPHRFLEGFIKSKASHIQYSCIWGS